MKKFIPVLVLFVMLCLMVGIGLFLFNSFSRYTVHDNFESIPLQFNPEDASSTYTNNQATITVTNGFVKALIKDPSDNSTSIVIRALSPLPSLQVQATLQESISLIVENINPDLYAKALAGNKVDLQQVSNNSVRILLHVEKGQPVNIQPVQPTSTLHDSYVILGDNRDGYDTFDQIIQQVNGIKPVFVIDNGDLVFSGKPNQYRLFDKMISNLSSTICTTLGNHDVRRNGRETYTMLYGPAYYSFDYATSHFVFLDSSPGWAEKTAISEAQYSWLEKDLAKAKGKQIFVITHIPSTDPRPGTNPNLIPSYVRSLDGNSNWVERKLDSYSVSKSMNHGFQDREEASRFEELMSKYSVDTVYLSHIHSYQEYYSKGVRYLITGGAGAELLTEDSYFHYLIAKIGDSKEITMVELPSPANTYIMRYVATLQLFALALYEENPLAIVLIILGLCTLAVLLVIMLYLKKKQSFDTLGKWFHDTAVYARNRFQELFTQDKDKP
ncbi:putative phosphohydrolase [Sphaerochaeta pleomorpha str. Grapes]|uniref:Putative phosphohydrolase n=1 Tax=Sphaerochaeta pleomorpha (strain ATCC BAA-1885 / DSM 22778 / Grapes) TaxID=158190 RepID=G8QT26_SPHPG|nr:metallophosphoesterase [Sphaerochaeta pleomorpha]AEV27931.1 putative phosphohydrolase [Sphaerochaeta pleomorpha str. Grapes]